MSCDLKQVKLYYYSNSTRCLASDHYDLICESSYIYKHCVIPVYRQFVQLHVAFRFSLQLSLPPHIS